MTPAESRQAKKLLAEGADETATMARDLTIPANLEAYSFLIHLEVWSSCDRVMTQILYRYSPKAERANRLLRSSTG